MEIVLFDLAKKLKEKGYPQIKRNAFAMYDNEGEMYPLCSALGEEYWYDDFDEYDYVAPTISQVLKWLREEKGWNIIVKIDKIDGWYYVLQDMEGECYVTSDNDCFSSYELANLVEIEYVLDKLI